MKLSRLKVDTQKCVFCGGCTSVCPQNAISLHNEATLEINGNICRHCNLCTTFCPMDALRIVKEEVEAELS